MKWLSLPSLILSLLIAASLHVGRNYIYPQWAIGMAACLLGFTWFAAGRVGWIQALTALYTLGISLIIFGAPRWLIYDHTPERLYMNMYQNSIYAFCCFFVIGVALLTVSEKVLYAILSVVPVYTVINAVLVIVGHLTGGINHGWNQPPPGNAGATAFLDYSGMNGCLIAIGLGTLTRPHWHGWFRVLCYFLTISAIVISSSSIAWGVTMLVIISQSLHQWRLSKKLIGEIAIFCVVGMGLLYWQHGITGFDSAQRFPAFKVFMGEWWQNGDHIWMGFGPGSFPALNQIIQASHDFMISEGVLHNWLWLHSDWLQSAFELGIVGFCLYLATAISVLIHLWRNQTAMGRELFSMAVGLCATAALDYPARYFVCAFLMAFVAVASRRLAPVTVKTGRKFGLNTAALRYLNRMRIGMRS